MQGSFRKDVINEEEETINDLFLQDLKIIQKKKGFRFMIDAVLLAHFASLKKNDRIIDLGTGTAVIPLIMSTREENLQITGVEIQSEMAQMAKRSVSLNKLDNIRIVENDLKLLDKSFNQQFNLVVSNPPYYRLNEGKVSENPAEAIARHEIKCNLPDIIATASRLIKGQGRFALIHKAERLGEIFSEFEQEGLVPKRLQSVHSVKNKSAALVLVEAQKGVKNKLEILKPLIIYDDAGNYTQEILDIYDGGGG